MTMWAAMQPAWAKAVWRRYLPSLYAGRRPDDFQTHVDAVITAIAAPGHTRAFVRTTRSTHHPAGAALSGVTAPTLVVMGQLDPDFKNPAAEADWIRSALDAQVVMVPEAGHYPHSQRPDLVTPAVLAFLESVASDA